MFRRFSSEIVITLPCFLGMILSVNPVVFYVILRVNSYAIFALFLGLCVSLFLLKQKFRVFNKTIIFIIFLQASFQFSASLWFQDFSYLLEGVQTLITLIFLVYIFTFFTLENIVDILVKLICVFTILAALGFVSAALNITPLISSYDIWANKTLYFYGPTVSAAIYSVKGVTLIRASGFFDEPGQLAFFIIHALVLNRIWKHNKKIELILILGGFATTSLAFIISLALYYLVCYSIKYKKLTIIFCLLIVMISGSLTYFHSDSSLVTFIQRRYLYRIFDPKSNKIIIHEKNSRFSSFENGKELLKKNFFLGVGLSKREKLVEENKFGGTSIMNFLVGFGVVGSLILYLHVFYMLFFSVKLQNIQFILLILILFLNYFQRPGVNALLVYTFIVVIGLSLKKLVYAKTFKNYLQNSYE